MEFAVSFSSAPTRALPDGIVALGASAGGLEALQQFFAALPANTGMAFIVVQHLSPDFKSLMPELLGRQTSMPVLTIDRNVPVRANTVYVLSAGYWVELLNDTLVVFPRSADNVQHLPIDRLFSSLASQAERIAAVVLSGTGQDGTAGAKRVKQAGGLVVAQVPSSARFDSMPRAIIDAGVADIVALPAEIGKVLIHWQSNPVEGRHFTSEALEDDSLVSGPYGPVLRVLQRTYDLDFGHYKTATIVRRIDRWLTTGGQSVAPSTLAAQIEGKQPEIDRLFGDLLIGVTRFFRDPDVFDLLRDKAIEPMLDALGEQDALRIWCCGCSTGEEAYTLAMLVSEAFDRRGWAPRLRILATDVHAASVQKASAGLYTSEVLDSVPAPLREKYFISLPSGHFKVAESLRRHVVFSVQNVLKDAGFQRIDLVCCRNMLIYLRAAAQAQVLASFHISLKPSGVLLLGKSETPSEQSDVFMPVDERQRLYRKRDGLQLPLSARPLYGVPGTQRPSMSQPLDNRASFRLQEVLAQRYVPSGLLVNQNDELVYVFGQAGRYLQAAPGRFGGTLFNLLDGALRAAVTVSLRKAAHSMTPASMDNIVPDPAQPHERLRIDVDPIAERNLPHHYFMVRITPQTLTTPAEVIASPSAPDVASAEHITELETELMRTREALQRSIEDLEAANEELQAGNEELMAANEELQSSNEELHALNEELYSVNSEHELKIQELRDTSADLSNLLRATELAIIFLDLEARLRLFTPQATQLFPLRPDDVGRELRDLLPRENDPTLFDDIAHTLVGQDTPDKNLCLSDQRVLRRRVTPYRTDLGVTNGVVITYVDVTQQVALREHRLEEAHQATLSAISRSVPHLMWTCTGEGACDFLNAQWVTYTGVPEAPQLGYGWLEQVHPDDHPGLMDAWNESVRTGLPFRTRFRIRRHDGQWRWFDTQGVPQLNEQGQIVKWYGSNTDVHDITLLTETLQARDEFIQMVTDNVNGMVGYWDRQLRNRFANRHYLAWFGKTAAEVRGMRLPDVLGSAVYEANRRYIEAALRGEPQHFQRTITKPDGTVGHLFAEYMPHIVNGEVLGFVVTATDITPVEEARLLADQVFLVSPVAKLIVDDKNRLLRWNPAAQQLLGYPDEQLQGLPLGMLIPPAMRQHHEQLQQAYLANPVHRTMGQSQDTTFPLVRADGSQVDVDIELSSVRLEGRQAVIVCIREAVLSPFAQKRLEQAHQARGTFLAQMSHEIRTPLNAILGMAQLLERESPTPKQMDRLRRIEDASNLLLNIVNDVLDLAKMEAGRMQLSCSPFHVNELVTRSLTLIEESARIKKLALHTHIASDVPLRLVGDERRIEQILVNLLSNAVKFTQQGEITVRITRHTMGQASTMLRFEVEDSGIGIAETQQKDLFTPFRQLQEGHARRYGGTGLGLSICRQLARLMNGECGVRSAPGYGSTFWFTAVLDTDPTAHASQPVTTLDVPALQPPATTPASGFPGKVVLVVEDNLINRTVIQELLTCETQVTVLEAEDGYQALAMAPQHTVDLVLMDIQMPGIDGLETTRRLRQMPGYATVPIYALTANVLSDDVNACLAAGMNGHFGKPLMFNDLLDTLHRLWADAPDASRA